MSLSTAASSASKVFEEIPTGSAVGTLLRRLQDRSATVGVIGLGYVGLPIAVMSAEAFAGAIGFDVQRERTEQLNQGYSQIQDVEKRAIASLIARNKIFGTTDFAKVRECDVIVICVPTPLNNTKDPDLSYIDSAAHHIAANLRPGQLVVLESTTYPGTTDELLLPLFEKSGLLLDHDFLLAFSPERVDPGSTVSLQTIPKIVGGCSQLSTQAACEFYGALFDSVHPVSNARAAETVKLLENTFRLVNIGLINEFAILCERLGIDTNEIIAGAATKPFGFMPFYPGPGVGGHCIPLDPLYLNWKAKQHGAVSRFIELADDVNTKMPVHVVELVTQALNDSGKALRNARVLVVGVAYKANIGDIRQSPAIPIIDQLRFKGAIVAYHDPHVPVLDIDLHGWTEWRRRVNVAVERRRLRAAHADGQPRRRRYDRLTNASLDVATLEDVDCVVILSKHDGIDYSKIARHARVIIDTRNAISAELRKTAAGRIVQL